MPQHHKGGTKSHKHELTSVIVPAYDEAHIIQKSLKELIRTLEKSVADYEIIVVDDGSNDGTAQLVSDFAQSNAKILVESYGTNRGKGYALRQGFKAATGDIIVFFDGDMDIAPSGIPVLINLLGVNNYDVVVGSKRHQDSDIQYPVGRRILSRLVYAMVWVLFRMPIRDTQVGLKVFRRKVLDTVMHLPRINGFAFDIELLALAHRTGFRIGEGPVKIIYQTSASHVSFRSTLRALKETLGAFYRMRLKRRRISNGHQ